MLAQTSRISPFRPSLFSKIVFGFISIIVLIVLLALIALYLVKQGFQSNQPEFAIVPLAQNLDELFKSENEVVARYFKSRDRYDEEMRAVVSRHFHDEADSLRKILDRDSVRVLLDSALARYAQYENYVANQRWNIKNDPAYDATSTFTAEQSIVQSVHEPLHSIKEAYIPALIKSLKKQDDRVNQGKTGTVWIFLLALAIGTALALLLAKNFTRPIKLLKAGTEKVAEGHYETVAVTSKDEIADLTLAFNLMSDKLKQLDEMRMQLMSEISHEMRTPLQVIKAGCYSIVHAKDGPPLTQRQRDAVGMIHQSTNRINQFVNSFLDIAKMEAGLMKFNFEDLNLSDVLAPLVQEAQLIANTRQITVEFTTEELPLIPLDKERMSQVFSNLLSNALKYTPDSGKITLRITKSVECRGTNKRGKGCVRIDVQDSGVGIPEADLQKLFSKFFQAKNTPLVNEKGSGLGLALVKHVSEAHGGQVSVTSTVGVGSTFTVLLPM